MFYRLRVTPVRRIVTPLIALVGFAAITTAETSAEASPEYPSIIAEAVGASSPPPCTVCHDSPSGGFGTATKLLAKYLESRGLSASDEGSLRTALAAAKGEKSDSDKDGVSDTDELKAGSDPNAAGSSGPPPAEYGCGNVSGARPANVSFAMVAAAAAAFVCRRRRLRS